MILFLLIGILAVSRAELFSGYEYQISEDGSAIITGYYGEEKKLIIPSELNGHPVAEIGDEAFFRNRFVNSVVIPEGVKTIGKKAFCKCRFLNTVIIPESVETIKETAFSGNRYLSSVMLPYGLKVIGDSAFSDCDKLSSVEIPGSVTSLGDFAFWNCTAMNSVSIPGTIKAIPFCAFGCCEKLKTLRIGEGVETIGEEAFTFCYALNTVTFPESITGISQNAFFRCLNLKSVNIPKQTLLNGNPFNSCSWLKEIRLSPEHPVYSFVDGVLYDLTGGKLIFYPSALRRDVYEIPEGITEIGACAFGGCVNLNRIIIPESVSTIGNDAFKWMRNPIITFSGTGLRLDLSTLPYLSPITPEDVANAQGRIFREQRYKAANGIVVNYYIYIPKADEAARKLPILIYFHGIQDTMEKHHGIGELLRTGQIHPNGIVILPQAANETVDADFHTAGYQDAVIELANDIADRFNGDMDRLSVSGHSDGGVTAYQIVNGHPGIFAACAPISPIGNTQEGIMQTNLWVFQGENDSWVKPSVGLRVALKCEQSGCSAMHYIYWGEGHNIQTMVYQDTFTDADGNDVKLIDWLMSKKLRQ